MQMLVAEAVWLMFRFIQYLVKRMCVDVVSSVGVSLSGVVARGQGAADAGC